jgi:hypothetical protein
MGMRRGGALLAKPRGPASGSFRRVEDEDEFEDEDDYRESFSKGRTGIGAISPRAIFS